MNETLLKNNAMNVLIKELRLVEAERFFFYKKRKV